MVAGSPGMEGAAYLCAPAAPPAGAGMVRLGVPGGRRGVRPGPGRARRCAWPWPRRTGPTTSCAGLERCRALVIGPGLGRDELDRRAGRAGSSPARRCRWWPTPTPCSRSATPASARAVIAGDGADRAVSHAARRRVRRLAGRPARAPTAWPRPGALADATGRRGPGQGIADRRRAPERASVPRPPGGGRARGLATAGTGDVLSRGDRRVPGPGGRRARWPPRSAPTSTGRGRRPRAGRGAGGRRPAGPAWRRLAVGARRSERVRSGMAEGRVPAGLGGDRPRGVGAQRRRCCAGWPPRPRLCAVVKADAYGHGATAVARARASRRAPRAGRGDRRGGGRAARRRGRPAPMLLLSEPPPDAADRRRRGRADADALHRARVAAAAERPRTAVGARRPVHVKVDTGMHRVGARPGDGRAPSARSVDAARVSAWRACGPIWPWPTAARPDDRGSPTASWPVRRGARPSCGAAASSARCAHAANSAGAIACAGLALRPGALRHRVVRRAARRRDGWPTRSPSRSGGDALRPVLSLRARVSSRPRACPPVSAPPTAGCARCRGRPGGHRAHRLRRRGARGGCSTRGGEVLIGGRRRPLAGTVTMDQIVVDCGPEPASRPATRWC